MPGVAAVRRRPVPVGERERRARRDVGREQVGAIVDDDTGTSSQARPSFSTSRLITISPGDHMSRGLYGGRVRTMAPERMRLLRRNLVSTYVVYGASVLSALVLTPVIVHALGKDAYGLWVFIGSITVFVALLDLGVGPSVVRFGAHARGAQTPEEISALASVGIVVYAVIGAASVLAGVVLAVVVPYLISIPHDLVEPARAATLLVVAGVAARFPLGLFNNLLLGQQRYDIVNVGNLTGLAVYFVLVAAILPWHGGIVLLATITLVSTLVRLGLPLIWLRRELPFLQLRRAFVSRLRIRELMTFSWHNFLIHLASKVAYSSDVIVVGIVLGARAAALYGVPSRVFALVLGLGTGATDLLYPAFAELEGADEPQRQQHLLLAGLRLGMALMLLLALPLVLIPDQLIYGWIGPGWGPSSAVLALLGVVLILHQPAQLLSQYLVARGYQRQLSLVLIVVVGANLALSIVLASAAGIWGVALATVVTEAAATVVLIPRLVRASSGPSYRAVAVAALRPVVPALFAAALVLVAFSRLLDPRTLLALALVGVLWIAAFVPAVWFFGLGAARPRGGLEPVRRAAASAPARLCVRLVARDGAGREVAVEDLLLVPAAEHVPVELASGTTGCFRQLTAGRRVARQANDRVDELRAARRRARRRPSRGGRRSPRSRRRRSARRRPCTRPPWPPGCPGRRCADRARDRSWRHGRGRGPAEDARRRRCRRGRHSARGRARSGRRAARVGRSARAGGSRPRGRADGRRCRGGSRRRGRRRSADGRPCTRRRSRRSAVCRPRARFRQRRGTTGSRPAGSRATASATPSASNRRAARSAVTT